MFWVGFLLWCEYFHFMVSGSLRATEQTNQKGQEGRDSSPDIEWLRLKCARAFWIVWFTVGDAQMFCYFQSNMTSSYLQSHYAIVVFIPKRTLKWDIKYMHCIIRTKSLFVDCTLRVGCWMEVAYGRWNLVKLTVS